MRRQSESGPALDCIALKFAGQADTIATALDGMRTTSAYTQVRSTVAGLRRALLDQILFRQAVGIVDVADVAALADC